jgi:hypothetical protein
MCCEQRKTTEHMLNGCSEMRERDGKERGEILNEDGMKMSWTKRYGRRDMEEEGKDREGNGWVIKKYFYKPYSFYRLLCAFLKKFAIKLPSK